MAELWFDAAADEALRRLEADTGRVRLNDRVQAVLDQRGTDPGHESVRQRRFQGRPLWGVPTSGDGEDWVVIWEPNPEDTGVVLIQYIGPASFA